MLAFYNAMINTGKTGYIEARWFEVREAVWGEGDWWITAEEARAEAFFEARGHIRAGSVPMGADV